MMPMHLDIHKTNRNLALVQETERCNIEKLMVGAVNDLRCIGKLLYTEAFSEKYMSEDNTPVDKYLQLD